MPTHMSTHGMHTTPPKTGLLIKTKYAKWHVYARVHHACRIHEQHAPMPTKGILNSRGGSTLRALLCSVVLVLRCVHVCMCESRVHACIMCACVHACMRALRLPAGVCVCVLMLTCYARASVCRPSFYLSTHPSLCHCICPSFRNLVRPCICDSVHPCMVQTRMHHRRCATTTTTTTTTTTSDHYCS